MTQSAPQNAANTKAVSSATEPDNSAHRPPVAECSHNKQLDVVRRTRKAYGRL